MKRLITIIIVICIVSLYTASASNLADSTFDYAATNLSSTKSASFHAETVNTVSSIRVTRVKLYQKIDDVWTYICDLPAPTEEATNDYYYASSADYSSYIGNGTYRLHVTYCANYVYSIGRYSNTRTY